MLAANILSLKPGTLIKGFNVTDDCTLSVNGWKVKPKSLDEIDAVRTIWYPNSHLPKYVRTTSGLEIIKRDYPSRKDIWQDWNCSTFMPFIVGAPVGILVGDFILCDQGPIKNLYVKLLTTDGQLGFIVLMTGNLHKREMVLI
jgi:hypothetical protein